MTTFDHNGVKYTGKAKETDLTKKERKRQNEKVAIIFTY